MTSKFCCFLQTEPLILPTESSIRTGFEGKIAKLGITTRIIANIDNITAVRLLARKAARVVITPAVVVADETTSGTLKTAPFELSVVEPFYALTIRRKYPHPELKGLLINMTETDHFV